MRHDPRPLESTEPDRIDPPGYTDPPAGYANLSALLRGLLAALEQRWTGSILIHDACGVLSTSLRCVSGYVVAGRSDRSTELFQAVLELCASREHLQVAFATDHDAVGADPDATPGRVDPWTLIAAVARSGAADACVDEVVQCIGSRSVTVRSHIAFGRFALTFQERGVVDIIDSRPRTLPELELHAGLPRAMVQRVVFTLWITRALVLGPTWLRTVSGPISHRAPHRNDEPTLVVVRESHGDGVAGSAGRSREHAPQHAAREQCSWMPETRPSQPPVFGESPHVIADRHFALAAFLLERGYAREAVFEAQKALRLCQPTPGQEALYAWALYQRSGAGSRIAQHVWEHLDNALRADPNCESAQQYRSLLLEQLHVGSRR